MIDQPDHESDLEDDLLVHLERVDQDLHAIRARARELLNSLQNTTEEKDN